MSRGSEYQKVIRSRKRAYLQAYKAERGCANCGERDVTVLEFDHRDPGQKNPVLKASGTNANSKGRGWLTLSWPGIDIELSKCDVVCANCHRRRTARQQGWIVEG